jgi:hypothetical protein
VEDGGDDVARGVPGELADVLTEIGLDHLEAGSLQMLVEPDLLGDHRFRLGHQPGTGPFEDRSHQPVRLAGVAGEMNPGPCRSQLVGKAGQQTVEMTDGVESNGPGPIPQLGADRQLGHGHLP